MASWDEIIQRKILRPLRLAPIVKIMKKMPGGSVLDIGCMDDYLLKRIPKRFDYYGIDSEPLVKHPRIIRGTIEENLPKNKKFDIVLCTEVLEHVADPPELIRKIKSLSSKYILITVPNEPFFSIARLFLPAKQHLWTIFPWALESHLGKPILKKKVGLFRTHLALWKVANLK